MARSGKHHYRLIKPKPSTSANANTTNENNKHFAFTAPPVKVFNRHMPEKWEKWEIKYLNAWFESNPNPEPNVRRGYAMQLTEAQLLKQMSGVRDKETAHQDFNEKETEWHEHYCRRVTNWFKNARAGLKRGKIPGLPLDGDLPDASFSSTTPIDANQSVIATGNLSELINTPTLTPYPSGSSFPVNYDSDGDDGNTPTPKMSHRHPDYDATPRAVPLLSVQPEVTTKPTLDDLATVAVEALQRREHNPYPQYPESVIYGAFLLLNLKG